MEIGREMLVDKLPPQILPNVVWREEFWLTDEALSVYVRSRGLFGHEMHSPIMCIGNGIPAIVCRFDEQTCKGYMWRDIGLGDWLFDIDDPNDVALIASTVVQLAKDPVGARAKVEAAQMIIQRHQQRMITVLSQSARKL